MDSPYYDLLRIYANELDREGHSAHSILAFSFGDKHILDCDPSAVSKTLP